MKDGFARATRSYERWRAQRIPIVTADLELKHERLAESPFVLLRGTYYRFLERFGRLLPELARAPAVVAVGDLHVENFGTWRDHDCRLAWGVNDFDELDLLPYTVDLVRLATSALLAIGDGHLALEPDLACESIWAGWSQRIAWGDPEPFVLGERHAHLYRFASEAFARPQAFSRKIEALPPFEGSLPKGAARLLDRSVPWDRWQPRLRTRVAGVGSLGARRIIAAGTLDGGLLVREAKQIAGPASTWLWPRRARARGLIEAVTSARGIAADPWRRQSGKWVLRPLAPDSTRVELASLRRRHDEAAILRSMGAEAANTHLALHPGAAGAAKLERDAGKRVDGWLGGAARKMAQQTERDHAEWLAARSNAR